MAEKNLSGMRVAIIATDLFEESELTEPKKALEEAGATTFVIAPHPGEIQGVQHDKKSQKVKVDRTLDDVRASAWYRRELVRNMTRRMLDELHP